jgi:hypothetical protein
MAAVWLLALGRAACGLNLSAEPQPGSPTSAPGEAAKPALSRALVSGYDRADALGGAAGPGVGATAIDFVLKDIQGDEQSLSGLLAEKPVLMVLGSYTCPVFRETCAATEALYSRYGDKVNFIVVYTIEAHPVGSASPYSDQESPSTYSVDLQGSPVRQPSTYDERVLLGRKTAAEAGISVPVLIDEMDNPVWCTYGAAPNAAYLIGSDGRVIAEQRWYDPKQIESAILTYLGGSDGTNPAEAKKIL